MRNIVKLHCNSNENPLQSQNYILLQEVMVKIVKFHRKPCQFQLYMEEKSCWLILIQQNILVSLYSTVGVVVKYLSPTQEARVQSCKWARIFFFYAGKIMLYYTTATAVKKTAEAF